MTSPYFLMTICRSSNAYERPDSWKTSPKDIQSRDAKCFACPSSACECSWERAYASCFPFRVYNILINVLKNFVLFRGRGWRGGTRTCLNEAAQYYCQWVFDWGFLTV